jgi:hypothetical protein
MKNVYPFNENAKTIEQIENSRAYKIREKLNNGGALNREEKDFITHNCKHNVFFKQGIPILGWKIDFSDVLKCYVYKQYDRWHEIYAIDKTSIRNAIYGTITKIVQVS